MALDPKIHDLPPHVRQALDDSKPKSDAAGDDKMKRDYRFHIDWQAPSGEQFSGWFVHRAPSIGQQIAIYHAIDATCRAKSGYFIDTGAQDILIAICNLEPTLIERPAWAKDLQAIVHPELLMAVSQEVSAHMRCFRGLSDAPDSGPPRPDA